MKNLTVNLVSDKLPEVGEVCIVAGGLAYWTGSCWVSMMDGRRPIQWEVKWWLPLLQDSDVLSDFKITVNGVLRTVHKDRLTRMEVIALAANGGTRVRVDGDWTLGKDETLILHPGTKVRVTR